MFETSEPCSSSNAEGNYAEVDDIEGNEDCSLLWSIDDDTMFYAQGLKHHSAGKVKSVYVSWSENVLLNFVFKTSSKAGTATLTKVRIAMPVNNDQQEIISNVLILEMNTLLYMESGSVYYFSSIKSLYKVDWLSGVRCMTVCPSTQFSVIRLLGTPDNGVGDGKRILSLEVYKDVPQLGKCILSDVLRHSYDITFDFENLFNCNWLDEVFTLTSVITDQGNITYLQQLVAIGDLVRTQQEITKLNINQEVHIFTISGNVFILAGGIVSEDELINNPQVDNFSIHLLNAYASPIARICIDCEHNLLIVLLQTGYLDIWYKSKRIYGSILHCQYEVPQFLSYDFSPANNVFFFTTPEEVLQLKIITNDSIATGKECYVKETRKCLSGMTACTFVKSLQQLICLSSNNIFYRINFATEKETTETFETKSEASIESLNTLYALNLKRVNELRAKVHIVDELLEQPKHLHNGIEKEFRKQQILALESKSEIFKKLFQCHMEYHAHLPGIEYFEHDFVHIKTSSQAKIMNAKSIFCLIFMSIKSNTCSTIFTAAKWYLHISYLQQYFHLHIPYQILNNKLCIITEIPLKDPEKVILPKLSLDLMTFLNHSSHFLCLKYDLNLRINEKTYVGLFRAGAKNVQLFRNSFTDIKELLAQQSLSNLKQICFEFKQRVKIPKIILHNVMKEIKANLALTTGVVFKIYYLHQYLIELNYDETEEILTICSNYAAAVFYLRLLLLHAMQSINLTDVARTSDHTRQQMLINCRSMLSGDADSNLLSMHLENLRNVYLKLRLEFNDTLR